MECVHCKSVRLVKTGFQQGKQRFKCKDCGKRSTENSEKAYPEAIKAKAIALYLEGLGFRSIGRLLNVSNVSVLNWVRKAAQALPELPTNAFVDVVELDELHHYVKKRARNSGCGLLLTVSEIRQLPSSSVAVVSQPVKNSGNR